VGNKQSPQNAHLPGAANDKQAVASPLRRHDPPPETLSPFSIPAYQTFSPAGLKTKESRELT
jgi:hypothetical protein